MKKALCLFLVVMMLVGLCGCFFDTDPEDVRGQVNSGSNNASTDKNEEPEDKEPEFSIGNVGNSTYTNSFLGLSCTLPAEWVFYTDEQMREMNNIMEDTLDEDVAEQLKNATIVYDMFATVANEGNSINVNMEKFSALQMATLNVKTVLESQIDTIISTYENMGYTNVRVVYEKVTVDGKEFDGLRLSGQIQGIDFYANVFAFTKGNYMANISIFSLLTDKTEEFLGYFTVE